MNMSLQVNQVMCVWKSVAPVLLLLPLIRLLMQYLVSRGGHQGDRSAFFICSSGAKKKPHCCSSCLTQYSFFMFVLFFFLT